MKNNEHKFKAKYMVPAYGLTEYIDENPFPKEGNKTEKRKYALRTLPLTAYNLAILAGLATAEVYGIYKGIEALIK